MDDVHPLSHVGRLSSFAVKKRPGGGVLGKETLRPFDRSVVLALSIFACRQIIVLCREKTPRWGVLGKETLRLFDRSVVLALSIFTCSHPHTIVDEPELNFCVRDGNRWTLRPINTNLFAGSNDLLDCTLKTEHRQSAIMLSKVI